MRQSGSLNEEQDKINVSIRNRTRLLLQNRKLLTEIYKLEQMISNIIERSAVQQWTGIEQTQQVVQKYKGETEEQLRIMSKLKKEIKAVKATIADQKYIEIRNQQNQLTFLRRQCEKLSQQKETLSQQKKEKQDALQYHQPLNTQTANTFQLYKKTKNANGQLKAKVHQLQREVTKYHNIKQMAKSFVPKPFDNPDYQIIKIDSQIANMRKEMKRIQQKWRSKVEAIDKEYFGLKNIKTHKAFEAEALEKQLKNYENHAAAIRDENIVAIDRQRINGIVISSQKRKQIQQIIEEEKKRLKRTSPRLNEKKSRTSNSQTKDPKLKTTDNNQNMMIFPREGTISQNISSQIGQKQEISVHSQKKQEKLQVTQKPKKITQSIGVGTTFYYTDD